MEFSNRIQKVKPSATLTINAKAAEMKAQGKNVISLAAGEPDFQPPDHVMQAAHEAISKGLTRYTPVPGMPDLLDAVAGYFRNFYGLDADKSMVVTTNGGKQGLYNLLQILLNGGDEVLIPSPYWVSYPDMVNLSEGKPVIVPTDPDQNFLTDPESLERFLSPKTKILILNSPSNPTGCHYQQDQFDRIIEWALGKGLFIISDEIYDQLVYSPAEPTSACKWIDKAPRQVAVVNGLSKSFAMTGWRIGYVVSHAEIIKNLSKIQGQSTSNICSIVQLAAISALNGSWDFLEEKRQNFIQRRDKALEIINSWPGAECPRPDGAFYVFPRLDSFYNQQISDSTALCEYLLDKAEVALVPGAAFGDDRCVRFSYALDYETLMTAMQRVGQALKEL